MVSVILPTYHNPHYIMPALVKRKDAMSDLVSSLSPLFCAPLYIWRWKWKFEYGFAIFKIKGKALQCKVSDFDRSSSRDKQIYNVTIYIFYSWKFKYMYWYCLNCKKINNLTHRHENAHSDTIELQHCILIKYMNVMQWQNRPTCLELFSLIDMFFHIWWIYTCTYDPSSFAL